MFLTKKKLMLKNVKHDPGEDRIHKDLRVNHNHEHQNTYKYRHPLLQRSREHDPVDEPVDDTIQDGHEHLK